MRSIRGIYTGKEIKLLEELHIRPNVRVIITFLEDEPPISDVDEDTEGLLALSGTWEDERSVETIIQDIYESRTADKEEIAL
jgi:hypothetical protein